MTDYLYDLDICFDPDNPNNIVRGGLIEIYDANDLEGTALLALKDTSGNPIPNPMMSNEYGVIGRRIAPVPQCLWKSGQFSGVFNSYKGLRDEAIAARAAAEEARNFAEAAGTGAAEAATAQLETAKTAATGAAASAATALAEAAAARTAAENAAAAASGGGVAIKPTDPDVLIVSTKNDGTVVIKPSDSDVLTITT
ncbi:hypothetical protein [Pseudarthrobacter polychromogenes]|uniref:Uncharacterized protein n=1 Tax=Pseudarthrobacter polychromogenes TaxID=1676 RepID=A0ABQ1Y2J7_9MICC|nr:hypothetical protein [Pseudarthrobacter polychromogenes]GGH10529.1 hypothetical protein GCM10011577_39370 [Pseudarthrobacter polychromogenes]